MNPQTALVFSAVAVLIAAVVMTLIINKKKGRGSCGSSCGDCAMKGICHDLRK